MSFSPILKIDHTIIAQNIKYIKNKNKKSKLLLIVKADAYGLGIKNIFKLTCDLVDGYGIARLEEYYELQDLQCKKNIFFLSGFYAQDFNYNVPNHVFRVLHCEEMVADYIQTEKNKNKQIYLKLESGMGRFGFSLNRFIQLINEFRDQGFNNITLFTHLPTGYTSIKDTQTSIKNIKQIAQQENLAFMFANSPISLLDNSFKGEYIRSGSAIIGFDQDDKNIRLSISLIAKIISLRTIKKGSTIGYGNEMKLKSDTYIAILNIGYADGLSISIHKNSYLIIQNTKCTILSVNMDYLYVDVSTIKESIKMFDDVVIFGNGGVSFKQHAKNYNISQDEALTRLNKLRIKRIVF